ncbi:serine beta-lactamase-like protein LACTB, mitochondrial [Bolinopsis microptera]|uniref:serine beta-lactamase-like protein LACTB, mitochondrial n=1 Tax=Bolinopsis microptera TaxID=2820187 RepID=UPI00307AB7B4
MRIASISKLITALMTVNLAQKGNVDLNENLVEFLKSNEIQLAMGDQEVDCMTFKQLLSHTAGVTDEGSHEVFSSRNYPTVKDGLQMFINDKLLFKPGSEYNYTTFGYSLLSNILEKSSGKSFEQLLSDFTSKLGLPHTRLDSFEEIILNRCQYYCKGDNGKLKNCPYVDDSCRWAGGGIVSTAQDIANLVTEFETQAELKLHYGYGMRVFHEQESHGKTAQYFKLSHNGGAVVLVLPLGKHMSGGKPRGITVVMFSNSLERDVIRLAHEIAASFEEQIEDGENTKYEKRVAFKKFLLGLAPTANVSSRHV